MRLKYAVIDNTSHFVRCFDSYFEANCFRASNNRLDWVIVSYYSDYKSTPKQQSAVRFCESVLNIKFTGNINSGKNCSAFLSEFLEQAKQFYSELKCEYETDRGY